MSLAALLAGCADSDDPVPTAPTPKTTATIGADGGTLTGPDGVEVVIPAGALDAPTALTITRTAAGAPGDRPDDVEAAPVYEFTPHDLVFRKPVVIRLPVAASVTDGDVFTASLGGEWESQIATIQGGMAEFARSTFSFGFHNSPCAPRNRPPFSASNPDPYPCSTIRGRASVTAQPAAALQQLTVPRSGLNSGSAGDWRVTQPASLRLALNYSAPPDCANLTGRIARLDPRAPRSSTNPKILFEGALPATVQSVTVPGSLGLMDIGPPSSRLVGATGVDVTFTEADNALNDTGTHLFFLRAECQRPNGRVLRGFDSLSIVSAVVPVPPVTVGGTVSGLTGAGLVLQNNGGNDLAVASDGAFTFATPVSVGSPYAVTVKTQPAGQACSVSAGLGTAVAPVTSVAVTCGSSTAPTWSAPVAVSPAGVTVEYTAVSAAADGSATVVWGQQNNVFASRWAQGAWTAAELAETLNSSNAFSGGYEPTVATGLGGSAAIGFGFAPASGQFDNGLSRSTSIGSAWGSELVPSNGDTQAIAANRAGTQALMLFETTALRSLSFSLTSGGTPVEASPDPTNGSASTPVVAPIGQTDFVAGWIHNSSTIRVNRFDGSAGAWGAMTSIIDPSNGAFQPAIAANAGSAAVVAWAAFGSNGVEVSASRLSAGTWSTPQKLAPQPGEEQVSQRTTQQPVVAVAVDPGGNAYVAWVQREPGASPQPERVRVRRCPAGQPSLSACEAAVVLDTRFERAGTPSLAVAPNGDVFAVWVSRNQQDVYELRVAHRGPGGWSAPITLGSADTRTLRPPSLTIDGSGRAIVAWEHRDGSNFRVFVARTQ